MDRMNGSTVAALALVLSSVGTAVAGPIVFEDNFNNGNLADSDSATNVWQTYKSPYTSPSTATESGGALTLFAGGNGSVSSTHQMAVQTKTLSSDFNFFTGAGKTYSVTLGSAVTGYDHAASSVNETTMNQFSLSISSVATNAYTANDAIQVGVRNAGGGVDNIRLAYKINLNNSSVNQYLTGTVGGLGWVAVAGHVTGYELTLSSSAWQLVVTHTGGLGTTTYSGTHAISASDWGTNGDSIAELEMVRSGGGANKSATAVIDRFAVSEVPEPASMGLMVVGGLLLMGRRR